jgi:hypothetical protein
MLLEWWCYYDFFFIFHRIKGRFFQSIPDQQESLNEESVGHGVMVFALMSKKANMVNVGHGIMVLALMSKISIWYCHYMSLRS